MSEKLSIPSILKRLWMHISPRRKKQFGLLFALMVTASFTEGLSIGAVLPFLAILTNEDLIYKSELIKPLLSFLNIGPTDSVLFTLTVIFCLAACLSAAVRLLLMWASAKLSFNTGADLSIDIYRKTLYQTYAEHISVNSSEIINTITTKTHELTATLTNVLTILSSAVMLLAITATLIYIKPVVAVAAFFSFGSLYGLVIISTRKKLTVNSTKIAKNSTAVVKSLQEGLSGIRDVLIAGTQSTYCEIYRKADVPLKQAQAENSFMAASPRYAMEGLGMVLIAILAYTLSRSSMGLATTIPTMGALAMGAQRLLPLLQTMYSSSSNIVGVQASLGDALKLLERSLPSYVLDQKAVIPMQFKETISLKNVSFRYSHGTPLVLKGINLEIKKGSRVGFVGTTGSGKSTLADLVMALLQPSEGELLIDGKPVSYIDPRSWQIHIAHVPQSIYLADATIAENIAFGVPLGDIEMAKVIEAATLAQIATTIDRMPEAYQTVVGERGVRLSGGQRQRIGIARALYRQADVIIFDEATSALDTETEQAVIAAIKSLSPDLTILTIAHRESTVEDCSVVYRVEDGVIVQPYALV